MMNYSAPLVNWFAFVHAAFNVYFLIPVSLFVFSLYICSLLVIHVVSPLLFMYYYQFKNDVQGPWDLPKIG